MAYTAHERHGNIIIKDSKNHVVFTTSYAAEANEKLLALNLTSIGCKLITTQTGDKIIVNAAREVLGSTVVDVADETAYKEVRTKKGFWRIATIDYDNTVITFDGKPYHVKPKTQPSDTSTTTAIAS